ncbi:MAG: DUF86 domain-containing protein [Calditrichaeota bacterium]|nr:DUF86 domain-containing protein [Calditrichota bacterium]
MPVNNDDSAYLWDMLDAAKAVKEFISGCTVHNYLNNRMLRSAVERQFEIVGEAANKVSRAFKETHPEISWRRIISQRHILAHEYGEIKHELLWNVATIHIPELITKLEKLIPIDPDEKDEG